MTETNAEQLEWIKSNGLVGTQELGYGTVESVDGLREGDFQWLIEQAERAQKLEDAMKGAELITNIAVSESKRLCEALEFYSNQENWWTYPIPGGYTSAAAIDSGRRARKGLEVTE